MLQNNGLLAIKQLLDLLGNQHFFEECCRVLNSLLVSDDIMAFYYRPKSAPTLLATSNGIENYEQGLKTFLTSTYMLNPVYHAYRAGINSGVHRVVNLIGEKSYADLDDAKHKVSLDKNEILGYVSYGWPRAQECVTLITNLPGTHMVEFAFLRKREEGFQKSELNFLREYSPLICAAVEKQFEINRQMFREIPAKPNPSKMFDSFCAETLTKREREVVKLILTGHSGQAIALKLGTALATAKTHRYNIYSKLEISSQAELFNLFLEFVSAGET